MSDHTICTLPSGHLLLKEPFEYVPPARYRAVLRTLSEAALREAQLAAENEQLRQQIEDMKARVS